MKINAKTVTISGAALAGAVFGAPRLVKKIKRAKTKRRDRKYASYTLGAENK